MKPLLIAAVAAAGLAVCACSSSGPGAAPTRTITVTVTTPANSGSGSTPVNQTPTPSPSPVPAGCLTRYLHGSIGLTQGTAGSVEVEIVFKNLDNVACTMYGYPGVALAAGTPVTDIGQPSTENPSTARVLVTLQPGGYANATLQVVDAQNYPPSKCQPVSSDWLEVIPPNQRVPLNIPYSSTACKGNVKLLSVTTVQPGNGG